jgi:hypothetical protein
MCIKETFRPTGGESMTYTDKKGKRRGRRKTKGIRKR